MGIFSWFKKVDENYKKNTKLGQWGVKKQKEGIQGMKDSVKEMKKIVKGESEQEETPQTSEEDKESK